MSEQNNPSWHILVVDDDRRLRDLLGRFLRQEGFMVSLAHDAKDARALLQHMVFDLMILDVMMPLEDGFSFRNSLPIDAIPTLFLTAKTEPQDRIAGLEVGGDDFLSKPFEPRELVLRVQNILKRLPQPENEKRIEIAGFVLHLERMVLEQVPEGVVLNEAEKVIVSFLMRHLGQNISRYDMAQAARIEDRSLDVMIARLRKKAPMLPIETARGVGYKLSIPQGLAFGTTL